MIASEKRKADELMSALEQNECLIADGFDEALIGMTHGSEPKAVYDIDQIQRQRQINLSVNSNNQAPVQSPSPPSVSGGTSGGGGY